MKSSLIDAPRQHDQDDLLGMNPYQDALIKFIKMALLLPLVYFPPSQMINTLDMLTKIIFIHLYLACHQHSEALVQPLQLVLILFNHELNQITIPFQQTPNES